MPRPENVELHQRILTSAENLFIQKGFHGVSVRDIAQESKTPLSNIYSHFQSKENLYRTLLENYEAEFFKDEDGLRSGTNVNTLPELFKEIGLMSRQMVKKYTNYFRLIYIDVVEFDGENIRRLFQFIRNRYEERYAGVLSQLKESKVFHADVDPVVGIITLSMTYFNYFTIENVFGATNHLGLKDDDAINQIAAIFSHGLLTSENQNTRL